MRIIADDRWIGPHGIGRFAKEVLARLGGYRPLGLSIPLMNPLDPLLLSLELIRVRPDVYFSPGFNPPLFSPCPYVFTIHDLIHLRFPLESSFPKRTYYEMVVKPAARRAYKVVTVSRFSKREILEWSGLPENQIEVVYNGVGPEFSPEGKKFDPGFPYILCLGSTKPHKNLARLFRAFAASRLSRDYKLVCTGSLSPEDMRILDGLRLRERLHLPGLVPEDELPAYYRGARAVIFPSLYEGFGLPALEAMASGVPLAASNVTAIPEVVGDAALLFDPLNLESMVEAIQLVVEDESLRKRLVEKGLKRAGLFTWEKAAGKVRNVLFAASEVRV